MSRLPHENRNVIDRPDLHEYELNERCPVQGCIEHRLENHHLWARSFGTKSWWVELWDGTIVGNRIGLCNGHHGMVTTNNARIVLGEAQNGKPAFFWQYHGEESKHKLTWQPPSYRDMGLQSQAVMGDVVTDMHTHEVVQHLAPQPGETCEKCKRRVPHKKKSSSPITKVWSTRVPVGDSDSFSELVDAAAAHHGLTSKPNHRFWTMQYALVLLLQAEAGELPA